MRSTLFLAALAAGAAHAYEKRVYVTDWTTVTVTKTVTAPAVTETVTPVQQVQVLTTSTQAPAPVAETTQTSELVKKSTEAVPANEPAPTQAAQEQVSTWSSAWTSTYEAASSTLQPQPATTEAASTTQAAASSAPSGANAYQQAILYNHNIHRSNHSVSSLDWNAELESTAHTLAARCVYEHDTSIKGGDPSLSYGQNIGFGVEAEKIGEMITNLMYNDEINYFPQPYGAPSPDMGNFDKWGHFSQIVWKGTTHVGCATVVCPALGGAGGSNVPFTVCNYSPPGNYDGKYGENVLATKEESSYIV